MTVEAQLYATLTAHDGFKELVATRVYPLMLPAGVAMPAVTYQRISGRRVHAVGSGSFLASPRVQFSCWGATYSEAKSVAEQLRAALDGAQGSMADDDDSAAMWMAQLAGDIDDYESATGRYRVIVDYVITHDEVG